MIKSEVFITCGGGSSPDAPKPAPQKPVEQDSRVIESRDNENARRRAAASNTVLTSYGGVVEQPTTKGKTLLGQ